jgi:hypothetical protein
MKQEMVQEELKKALYANPYFQLVVVHGDLYHIV